MLFDCQLSKKRLHVRVTIFEDGSPKEFDFDFKVLKKLPYEAIVGRRDMVVHRLTLPNLTAGTEVPWERRVGPPILQAESVTRAHFDEIADQLFVSAKSDTLNQGAVPPARVSGSRGAIFSPTAGETLDN